MSEWVWMWACVFIYFIFSTQMSLYLRANMRAYNILYLTILSLLLVFSQIMTKHKDSIPVLNVVQENWKVQEEKKRILVPVSNRHTQTHAHAHAAHSISITYFSFFSFVYNLILFVVCPPHLIRVRVCVVELEMIAIKCLNHFVFVCLILLFDYLCSGQMNACELMFNKNGSSKWKISLLQFICIGR